MKENRGKFRPGGLRGVACTILCGTTIIGLLYFILSPEIHASTPRSNSHNMTEQILKAQSASELHFASLAKTSTEFPQIQLYQSNYPSSIYRSLLSIIQDWNPDHPDAPLHFKETLQHFNYSNPIERNIAQVYRDAEVPFKLYNVPEFDQTVALWSDGYLIKNLDNGHTAHVEQSKSNHFMFWNMRGLKDKTFVPPTNVVNLSFKEWLLKAHEADAQKLSNASTHYYFMTGVSPNDGLRSFVSRDLPLFSTRRENFFITNVRSNKGIQCRFSMRGIIAETHYDAGKNMIAMLKGAKRYILTPPHSCKKLAIISDTNHPSYRHSVIDWSDEAQAIAHDFAHVDAIDTIVNQGEIL
jgi:hypothetical protein